MSTSTAARPPPSDASSSPASASPAKGGTSSSQPTPPSSASAEPMSAAAASSAGQAAPAVGTPPVKKLSRVALVGVGLLVAGLVVLAYSASVLSLTCRADNDPSPQRAGWCELRETLAFGMWEAPRRRFQAQHFVDAQPEIAFNKESGRVVLTISAQRKPLPLGHHRSRPRERSAEINTIFEERNGGPINYEEGYSVTGMVLAGAMIFTGIYLTLRVLLSRDTRPAPTSQADKEKKTQ